jgi:hypothetical protein
MPGASVTKTASREVTKLPAGPVHISTKDIDVTSNGNKTLEEIAEGQSILADMTPLQPVIANIAMDNSSNALKGHSTDGSQPTASKSAKKPWLILPDSTDLNNSVGTTGELYVNEDDDDMFTFDEATDRPPRKPMPESDTEEDSSVEDTAEEEPLESSRFATSPGRPIPQLGTAVGDSTKSGPSASRRSSYHPFNTPIVAPEVHEQAASLGNITSFVGSVKNGLEEMALQSFRGGGSLRGGAPTSLSERMAFDEAMEARREAAKKK